MTDVQKPPKSTPLRFYHPREKFNEKPKWLRQLRVYQGTKGRKKPKDSHA